MHGDILPDANTDPGRHHVTVRVTPYGVSVMTGCRDGVELVTGEQAREIAEQVEACAWSGVFAGGGAVLSARPLEACVVVRCAGYASVDECLAFAADLRAAADTAGRYVPPETQYQKRKAKKLTGVAA